MIEIIGTIYLTSMFLTWTTAILYYNFKLKKQFSSREWSVLNANLRKLDMYWSLKNSDFQAWKENAQQRDCRGLTKSFFIMTTILSLLSLLGFILFSLIVFVGYSRKEVRVFNSELAGNPELSSERVRELVNSLG